ELRGPARRGGGGCPRGAARPGPFLPRGLLAPAADEVACLCRGGAGATRGELALHHLVEEVLPHRACDHRRGHHEVARRGPVGRQRGEGHGRLVVRLPGHWRVASAALVSTTVPLRAPGTAPRTRIRCSSGRSATTSRLRVVMRSAPRRPAMRFPLNTRPA